MLGARTLPSNCHSGREGTEDSEDSEEWIWKEKPPGWEQIRAVEESSCFFVV